MSVSTKFNFTTFCTHYGLNLANKVLNICTFVNDELGLKAFTRVIRPALDHLLRDCYKRDPIRNYY